MGASDERVVKPEELARQVRSHADWAAREAADQAIRNGIEDIGVLYGHEMVQVVSALLDGVEAVPAAEDAGAGEDPSPEAPPRGLREVDPEEPFEFKPFVPW